MAGFDLQRKFAVVLLAMGGLMAGDRALAQEQAPEPPPAAESGAGVADLFRDFKPTPGPIRWRATLTTEYRLQLPADRPMTRDFLEFGTLTAATYLFQPWFAQVSGNLGFVRGKSGGGDVAQSRSTSLTGGGSVSLLPASRFPFSATYSVSDSRASGEITGSDYRSTQFGLRQSYRAADGTRYAVRYDRSDLAGTSFGKDTLNVFGASASRQFGAQSFDIDGQRSANNGGGSGTQSTISRLTGRYTYVPASNLNLETLATYNRQDLEQNNASLRSLLSNRFMQLASFASWRPEEDEPLYDENHPMLIAGGLRVTASGTEQDTVASDNLSMSGSLGVNYTINPLTRLSANASLTHARPAGGAAGLFSSQNASLTYSPLPFRLGEYNYNWNLSGSASNSMGNGVGQQNLTAQARHGVSRDFPIAQSSQVSFSLGQGLGATMASGASGPNAGSGGTGLNLSHNALIAWMPMGESTTQTYVSVSASDARNIGTPRNEFQLVNLQATRQAPLTAQSFWTANVTMQGTRQRSDPIPGLATPASGAGFNFTTFGSVTYQHRQFFGIPRLRLFASYVANQTQLQSRALGDLTAPRSTVTGALEGRLEYQLGRVDSRLTFRTANVEGKRNSLLFLRVTRQF